MIRSAITVSLVPEARSGPFVFHGDLAGACRKARELGFDAIELFPPAPDAVEPGELRRLLDDHGLSLAAVGTGAGWVRGRLHLSMADAGARAKAIEYIARIIDFAGGFGASAIIGSMQGRHGDGVDEATATGRLCEALQTLGERARAGGQVLLYEPLNRYETNLCNTLGAGGELLGKLSTQSVRLLADLFHMNIEETELPAAIQSAGAWLGHIHFVDSNRRPAGLGHIAYGPIIEALRTIGYAGYLSAECLPYPDSDAAAEQTMAMFRQCTGVRGMPNDQ